MEDSLLSRIFSDYLQDIESDMNNIFRSKKREEKKW